MCAAALIKTERMLSARRRTLVSAIGCFEVPCAAGWALPAMTGCTVGEALLLKRESWVSHVRSPSEALSAPWTRR